MRDEQLRSTFEQAAVGVAHVGLDGRWLFANQRLCDIVGYPHDELVRLRFQDIKHPADLEAERVPLRRLQAGEIHDYTLEERYLRKDRTPVWVKVTVSLVRDSAGTPQCFIVVVEDITGRRHQEAGRDRLLEQEQAARARVETDSTRLRAVQTVTDAALASLGLDDLLNELMVRIRHVLNADTATILLLTDDGRELVVRAAIGLEEEVMRGVRVPFGRGFAGRIAATRAALVVPDLSRVDVVNEYLRERLKSVVGAPLHVEQRVIGVIHVGSLRPGHFTDDDARLLQLVADRAALAIDHARLFEGERAARAAAEAAHGRLQFLVEASAVLAASLDYETTLTAIARLIVPRLADWCLIDVVGPDGSLQRMAAEHVDPARASLLHGLRLCLSGDGRRSHPVVEVINTGRPFVSAQVTDELLVRMAQDGTQLDLLRGLAPRALIVVPLSAHGMTLGAATLAWSESDRAHRPDDLALAEELARRAAVAVDHARLYQEARQALSVREEFLTSVSHDLRTPLTSAKGFAQILQRRIERRGLAGVGPEVLAEGFKTIDASLTRMAGLVSQLLDISRLHTVRTLDLDLRPTDLVGLARQVVAEHRRTSNRHQIDLDAPMADLTGLWDPLRLERVLGNLVSNAVKYSPLGGRVRVTVSGEQDEDGREWAMLTVQDSGVGIPAADLPHIFERFRRGGNVVGRIPGTGVGMAGARQIVEQHGGTIAVASELDAGTTVTVCLPLKPHGAPDEAAG